MTKQKKNLKTISSAYPKKNTDLILKMIKKAKIIRVRVPLCKHLEKILSSSPLNYV
jgi:hypothetical protein